MSCCAVTHLSVRLQGARAIAAGLGLPYTFVTCNAGTEMYNFIGDMMPVDSSATSESINAELFKEPAERHRYQH